MPRKPLQVGRKIYKRDTNAVFYVMRVQKMHMKSGTHYEYLLKPHGGKTQKMPIMDDILSRLYKLSK